MCSTLMFGTLKQWLIDLQSHPPVTSFQLQRHKHLSWLHHYRYWGIQQLCRLQCDRFWVSKNCIGHIVTLTQGAAASGAVATEGSNHGRNCHGSSKQGRSRSQGNRGHRKSSHGSRSHGSVRRSSSHRSSSLRSNSNESCHRIWGHGSSSNLEALGDEATTGAAATRAAAREYDLREQQPQEGQLRHQQPWMQQPHRRTAIPRNPMTVYNCKLLHFSSNTIQYNIVQYSILVTTVTTGFVMRHFESKCTIPSHYSLHLRSFFPKQA
jgi:hypothetical protein